MWPINEIITTTQWPKPKSRIFKRFKKGKSREATRYIKDRQSNGVLMPEDNLPEGQNVFEILKRKDPCQMISDEETFSHVDDLPIN